MLYVPHEFPVVSRHKAIRCSKLFEEASQFESDEADADIDNEYIFAFLDMTRRNLGTSGKIDEDAATSLLKQTGTKPFTYPDTRLPNARQIVIMRTVFLHLGPFWLLLASACI